MEFEVILGYIESSRPAWTTMNPGVAGWRGAGQAGRPTNNPVATYPFLRHFQFSAFSPWQEAQSGVCLGHSKLYHASPTILSSC